MKIGKSLGSGYTMVKEVIFVWYRLGWICGVMPVNITQECIIILLVNDYSKGYQRLQFLLAHSKICHHGKSLQKGVLFK
jgi:hypothetical protein